VSGRPEALAFAAVWLAAICAAALDNYPTPVVGYSGAAVLGYVLSLAGLPRTASSRVSTQAEKRGRAKAGPDNNRNRLVAHPLPLPGCQ
jgi:hypothetical protein